MGRKSPYIRFWGYCTDSECRDRGKFISVRRTNIRCPTCKGSKISREERASINAHCQNESCWMSSKQEDKTQRYFPYEDARCEACRHPVFFLSRANGPGAPAGLYHTEQLGEGSIIAAYSHRAIATANDSEYLTRIKVIIDMVLWYPGFLTDFLVGMGPDDRLALDDGSNLDYFIHE